MKKLFKKTKFYAGFFHIMSNYIYTPKQIEINFHKLKSGETIEVVISGFCFDLFQI